MVLVDVENELKEAKNKRDKLKKRLRENQADISDEQWLIMHRQVHAMDRYISCLIARVKEFKNE
ncbi:MULTISPECIES: hypothetical protein [Lactobacillus]|uniref:Uncharacterized protein n=1 Tax=Lactobacillus xujianguonis TaxID=2495899 RepID=A0A437ST58_9LACO|nr:MULTISPECIES: hypothetical protein [Lactobacillus]RVU70027.1 hypothetical protein EJK17_09840 [Lactobacillus xujianguonis]RVU73442.1 hypothetical protein EJK20_08140 [Lactobacillus xujianguonis]